jgi:hypothetical protein
MKTKENKSHRYYDSQYSSKLLRWYKMQHNTKIVKIKKVFLINNNLARYDKYKSVDITLESAPKYMKQELKDLKQS